MVARDGGNVVISLSDKRLLSMDEFAIYTSMGMNRTRELALCFGQAGGSWLTVRNLTVGVMNTLRHKTVKRGNRKVGNTRIRDEPKQHCKWPALENY